MVWSKYGGARCGKEKVRKKERGGNGLGFDVRGLASWTNQTGVLFLRPTLCRPPDVLVRLRHL